VRLLVHPQRSFLAGTETMKCFFLLLFCLSSLISNVCSLGLTIQLNSLDGMRASVLWTRQKSDPNPLGFDLRFMNPPYTDVGLAEANVYPNVGEISGNVSIEFPKSGKYMLVAVSGLDHVQIGRSAEIEIPISTSTPTMSNAFASPTNVIRTTVTVSAACRKEHVSVPAIIGGVIGGVSLLALLAAAVFFIRRRRARSNSRISFHGDMMVQQNDSDGPGPPIGKPRRQGGFPVRYAFTKGGPVTSSRPPILANRSVVDVEQGLPIPSPMTPVPGTPGVRTPLGMRSIVPPPLGPRVRTHKSYSAKQPPPPKTPSPNDDQPTTSRQQQLTEKLAQVEKQIEQMKSQSKPGPSEVVLLDDLELQKAWLEKQLCCMWALGETDTLPPGFSRYMLDSLEEDDNVG